MKGSRASILLPLVIPLADEACPPQPPPPIWDTGTVGSTLQRGHRLQLRRPVGPHGKTKSGMLGESALFAS